MVRKRKSSLGFSRLLILLCLALSSTLMLGGSPASPAQAGLPVGAKQQVRPEVLVMRVYFRDAAERDRLAVELDAHEVATTGGFLTVWADRATYHTLLARGLRVEIDEVATKQANNLDLFGEDSPDTFYGGYRTVEENNAYMDTLVAAYPTLAMTESIGVSWCRSHPGMCTQPNTWNGYDLVAIRITNRNIPGPGGGAKPVFWFETGIHSREIATPEMATRFMSHLLDGYNNDPDATWLVDHHDIWVLPMVNPDGHHMVENGNSAPRTQRKNADRDDGCTAYPPTDSSQLGTDLNRNFPFLWGCCGGSSGSPCNLTYRGPLAGSEDETIAVTNKIRQLIPDQRGTGNNDPAPIDATGIYQSMHSYAALHLYPWGWTTTSAPNGPDMANIGRHMSATNANPPGNTYTPGQPPQVLYAVDGDTADWGYGELGIPSYTTELRGTSGGFFPPFSDVPTLWNENRGPLLYQAKIARTPYLLTHGPDSNNVVTNPMTVTQGSPSQLTATINYAWTGNSFSQNVAAAEYYIDTPPWLGGTAIPMAATDGNFNSPTEAVQATIDTTTIPAGRHLIFVRGRGLNNYGGFETWGPVMAAWLTVTGGGSPSPTVTGTPPTATLTATAPTATRTSTAPPATATPCSGGAVLTGSLDAGDPDFTRPNTFQQGGTCTTNGVHNYDVYTLQTSGGQVTASTCGGASWDTYLIIYQAPGGAPIPGFVPSGCTNAIAANDDACGLQSTVTANLAAGTYYVVVSEFSTPGGAYTVNVTAPGACGTPGTATSTRTMTVGVATATASATCVPAGSIVDVSISGFAYSPQNVTIGVGTSVRWTNTDAAAHTSTSNTGVWDSGSMGQGAQYSFTFTTPGTYPYHCTFHPSMTGTITVQAAVPCATNTVVATSTSTRTNTAVATNTRVGTPITTGTPTSTRTIAPTQTPGGPTATTEPSQTPLPPTSTSVVAPTSTPCTIMFSDVPVNHTFYPFIRCLACRGIISGYADGTFKPGNEITRGQIAKMVSNAAGFSEDPGLQIYEDVNASNTFYVWINRLSRRGHMGGYACGTVPEEPCVLPQNRPYFRPYSNATRGQLAKIVSNAAGIQTTPSGVFYTDVQEDNPFYVWIMRLTERGVMSGYECGGVGEPCDPQNRPYFRPFNNVTRGQASKIVANTFYPGCETSR